MKTNLRLLPTRSERRNGKSAATASLIFLLTLVATPPSPAQKAGLAHSGPRGIWVDLGAKILPANLDGKTVVSYRVERREKGAKNWTKLADVAGPSTQFELEQSLKSRIFLFPELGSITINIPELWKAIETTRDIAAARIAGTMLPVQAALGVRWLDSTVQQGRIYEYRVARIADDGTASGEFTTKSISYPQPVFVAPLLSGNVEGSATEAIVVWRAGAGVRPATFTIFRREGISGPFSLLNENLRDSCCVVSASLLLERDTLLCRVIDRTVKPGIVYQYYLKPTDYFRNPGRESDTATIITFNMAHVPLPQRMKARSVDTAGLQLRWTLYDTSAVHGIVIERSIDLDTGYVRLFTAAPADTGFIDVTVNPMERYYYRLRLVGPGGLLSPPSATIMGHFRSSATPPPPSGVTATGISGGILLSWMDEESDLIEGYHVLRAEGIGDELRLVSPMLPPEARKFTDTLGLQGGYTYAYCVQAISTSHVPGVYSDTVTAQAVIPMAMSAPMGLHSQVDDNRVYLFWKGQAGRDAGLAGYRVYRREAGEARWKPLTDTLLYAWQNNFQDDRITPGKKYAYSVRAFSITGDSSAMSAAAFAVPPLPSVYPPANLKARVVKRDVVLKWDEVAQPAATGFKLYRYTRGSRPSLVATLKTDDLEYTDTKPGAVSPVFYYLTTTGKHGAESEPGPETSILLGR